ncbi:phosphonate C-P lyase system protein PhnH [Niveibacterium sp. 24ML]|uniref:phosphonate C-P lyase system protein PhnH n=1 Tax=Niveibacterium sp. 24ML TaxID=2985512 RepID=UPI002271A5E9|nr:phosphonate C-P lyase system protein PhnH [Niveibacterium sp. 24ML]MCX9156071.1 phosphonate C-P lyase system protein PhnH [Niveibacterium sp. 24ML]
MRAPLELDLSHMQPGFADPVHDGQACFRALLEALARPGRITALDAHLTLPAPPPGIGAAQLAILLALADQDTAVWIAPELRNAAAGHYLRFHCGCALATTLAEAHFVVIGTPDELPALDALRLGDPAFPDRSATLLLEVAELHSTGDLSLRGPGIEHTQTLGVGGWNAAATAFVQENQRRFPLGVDTMLCCGTRIAGLPRTTLITEGA